MSTTYNCGCDHDCDCNCEQPINCIEQAVNDALAGRIDELDGYADRAETGAENAEASATDAANSATQAGSYRDQSQVILNSAQVLVPEINETSAYLQETAELAFQLVQNASSYQIIKYTYTVIGGESTITVPESYDALTVQSMTVEGSTLQSQTDDFTFDSTTRVITLTQPFDSEAAGTKITIQLGQSNAESPETVLSALNTNSGAGLVGTTDGVSVQTALDSLSTSKVSLSDLASNASNLGSSLVGLIQGGNVQQLLNFITLESMNEVSDDAAFTAAVAKQKLTGYPILLGWKTYTLNLAQVFTDVFDVTIIGMGKGRSILNLTHLGQGLRFGPESDSGSRAQITLEGFTINRVNYESYTGTIGPKNLYVSNRDSVLIQDVEVIGNIGYGIQTDYSEDILINFCQVKNAVGGYTAQKAGTDGIHLYRCKRARVTNCFVTNVGDDAFSCGSYDIANPAVDIMFANNIAYQCAGGFKAYTLVDGVIYYGNTIRDSYQAAFYLTNDANNITGSYVQNIHIVENKAFNVWDQNDLTNIESGFLRVRMWPDKATANATGLVNNVYVYDNHCESSAVFFSHVVSDEYKRLQNIYMKGNNFKHPQMVNSAYRPAIRFVHCDYECDISENHFSDLHSGAIAMVGSYYTYTAKSQFPVWTIKNNTVRGYNDGMVSTGATTFSRAINIGESGYHILLNMVNNNISDCAFVDGIAPSQSILTGLVSPLSHIEGNNSDLSQNLANSSGAYKGVNKTIGGAPSAGTHYRNSRLKTSQPTTSLLDEYECYQDGSYGTLTGITATTSTTSRTIVVNSSADLYVGCVIAIAGVSGTFIVRSISDNNVQVSTLPSAAVSEAAVSFSAPLWRKLSWATATPVSSSL